MQRFEAEIFQTKPLEYGMPEADLYKGFGSNGFNSMMDIWELASRVVAVGRGARRPRRSPPTSAATEDDHMFGSTPLSCATAPPRTWPCATRSRSSPKWDGANLVPVTDKFSGADLIAGTGARPGP